MNTRPMPPDIEFGAPPCPICEESVNYDGDSMWCDPCRAKWNREGRDGDWTTDGDIPQCESTFQWRAFPEHRCILPQGHPRVHGDADTNWPGS